MTMIPVKTTLATDVEPLSAKEWSDHHMKRVRKHREFLLIEIAKECRSDKRFLDRVLKELRPLRKQGRSPVSNCDIVTDSIIANLKGFRPGEIVETISVTLGLSLSQARRYYDAALDRVIRKPHS